MPFRSQNALYHLAAQYSRTSLLKSNWVAHQKISSSLLTKLSRAKENDPGNIAMSCNITVNTLESEILYKSGNI